MRMRICMHARDEEVGGGVEERHEVRLERVQRVGRRDAVHLSRGEGAERRQRQCGGEAAVNVRALVRRSRGDEAAVGVRAREGRFRAGWVLRARVVGAQSRACMQARMNGVHVHVRLL